MRWLHLSDLHVGSGKETQDVALTELIGAINTTVQSKPLDFVLFTGDLAYSGQQTEYQRLLETVIAPLRQLDTVASALFVSVPGNHDLDCDASHPITWANLGEQRKRSFFNFDENGLRIRRARADGFSAYSRFLEETDIAGNDPTRAPAHLVTTTHANLLCVNTAYFSDKEVSDEKACPAPVHPIRYLLQQLDAAKQEDASNQLIVLGHHPIHWFTRESVEHFRSLLLEKRAIYLHGHEHSVQAHFSDTGLYALGFSAAHQADLHDKPKPYYRNTFALCEMTDSLHVAFYSWGAEYGNWRPTENLPADFRSRSSVLQNGFVLQTPSSPAKRGKFLSRSREIRSMVKVDPPLWIECDDKTGWTRILELIGELRGIEETTVVTTGVGPPGHIQFVARDTTGRHLIRAASAPSAILTYDQIERTNTFLDTESESLDSSLIVTFGALSQSARDLAARLGSTKPLKVLEGAEISAKIADVSALEELTRDGLFDLDRLHVRPLVVPDGMAFLITDGINQNWFSIVNSSGQIVSEHDQLPYKVRDLLPQYANIEYREAGGSAANASSDAPKEAFNRQEYLERCSELFDDVKYAGLAAVGFSLPTESLRKLYVPAAADVDQSQTTTEALQHAVSDFVEALGLDNSERDQLESQLKHYYGIGDTAEAGAARRLYQQYENILVLGDPGSGKSCFTRYEILAYCRPPNEDTEWYANHVPIFLPLVEAARFVERGATLLDMCAGFAVTQRLKLSKFNIEELIASGQVAFFFDGLDEIVSLEQRQKIVGEIGKLVERSVAFGNRFVLTSRPAAAQTVQPPKHLTKLNLRGLTDTEIRLLATRIVSTRATGEVVNSLEDEDKKVVDQLIEDLVNKPGIRRLARNPLLLTLLVLIYVNSGPMVAKRHIVYQQAVKTLVSVRHRERRGRVLAEADLRKRLGFLALSIYRYIIDEIPSRKEIGDVLGKQQAEEAATNHYGADQFIQDVAETTGLLVIHPRSTNRNDDVVSFMHHSFLEYYAAVGCIEENKFLKLIPAEALNARWRDVVTLMFGLLGEQTDVTDFLFKIVKPSEPADDITGSRLLFGFDCALECDVPPERSQQHLANLLSSVLSDGVGRVVSEYRQELAPKVNELLENTGSEEISSVLLEGLGQARSDVCASFVDFVGRLQTEYCQGGNFVKAIEDAFERKESSVRLACVAALESVPAFRTEKNLAQVRFSLQRGAFLERHAALQLIDRYSTLAKTFAAEVIDLIGHANGVLASLAARCALTGGIFALDRYEGRGVLDRALRAYVNFDRPQPSLIDQLKISRTQIERWLYSESLDERRRGIRVLVATESDSSIVRDHLFSILRGTSEHEIIVACLRALSLSKRTIATTSLAETDFVCSLLSNSHQDVRVAAVRALARFPSIDLVTRALEKRYGSIRFSGNVKERVEILRAFSTHGTESDHIQELVESETTVELSRRDATWSKSRKVLMIRMLHACDQIGVPVSDVLADRIYSLATAYKTSQDVRKVAVETFGTVAPLNQKNATRLLRMLVTGHTQMRVWSYRSVAVYLGRCNGNYAVVSDLMPMIGSLKEELVKRWNIEVDHVRRRIDYTGLRHIRNALLDIERMLVGHEVLSDRIGANAPQQSVIDLDEVHDK